MHEHPPSLRLNPRSIEEQPHHSLVAYSRSNCDPFIVERLELQACSASSPLSIVAQLKRAIT